MAVLFTAVMVTIIKNQGGANKSKEDAAVDAAFARAEAARQASGGASHRPPRPRQERHQRRFRSICIRGIWLYIFRVCPGHWEISKTPS